MEKIYEEKSSSQRSSKSSLSIILSFVVAIFAIMSLIVAGFNQISYAAPTEGSTSVEDMAPTPEFLMQGTKQVGLLVSCVWRNNGGETKEGSFFIPIMYNHNLSDEENFSNYYLFCIQQGREIEEGGNYQEVSESAVNESFNSDGVSYILSKSSLLGGEGIAIDKSQISSGNNKYIEYYATQIAIWLYLDESAPSVVNGVANPYHGKLNVRQTNGDGNEAVENDYTPMEVITNATKLELIKLDDDVDLTEIANGSTLGTFKDKINTKVSVAKNPPKPSVTSKLASADVSLLDDGKTYQTDKIEADVKNGTLTGYEVLLSGIKEAYVVDENGNKVADDKMFRPNEKFRIRVPKDKVTEKNSTVYVTIFGYFENVNQGEYYALSDSQAVTKVTTTQLRTENEKPINFLVSPDTGMTTAQTIYFIGLIVLLCGVGIIYANAKPVEEK